MYMSKITKIFLSIIAVTLIPGLLIAGCSGNTSTSRAIIGQKAPDFTLMDIDGESVSLSDF